MGKLYIAKNKLKLEETGMSSEGVPSFPAPYWAKSINYPHIPDWAKKKVEGLSQINDVWFYYFMRTFILHLLDCNDNEKIHIPLPILTKKDFDNKQLLDDLITLSLRWKDVWEVIDVEKTTNTEKYNNFNPPFGMEEGALIFKVLMATTEKTNELFKEYIDLIGEERSYYVNDKIGWIEPSKRDNFEEQKRSFWRAIERAYKNQKGNAGYVRVGIKHFGDDKFGTFGWEEFSRIKPFYILKVFEEEGLIQDISWSNLDFLPYINLYNPTPYQIAFSFGLTHKGLNKLTENMRKGKVYDENEGVDLENGIGDDEGKNEPSYYEEKYGDEDDDDDKEKSNGKKDGDEKKYWIDYTSNRFVVLNDKYIINKMQFNRYSDVWFEYLSKNPNKNISLEEIRKETKKDGDDFIKFLNNIKFKGQLRELFFTQSKGSIIFHNPITENDFDKKLINTKELEMEIKNLKEIGK
ncbi:MAG: hypothetical protein ABSA74_01025 [Candidatus Staskawiczbacteria bacterium]